MRKKSTKSRVFSKEFKLNVVSEYLTGSFTKYSICKKYDIDTSAFSAWLRIFAPDTYEPGIMAKQDKDEQIKELKLLLRQKELELGQVRMRADFYQEMVEVAEEMFGLEIRKKAGTKQ